MILKCRIGDGKYPSSSSILYLPDSFRMLFVSRSFLLLFIQQASVSVCIPCNPPPAPAIYPVRRIIIHSKELRIQNFSWILLGIYVTMMLGESEDVQTRIFNCFLKVIWVVNHSPLFSSPGKEPTASFEYEAGWFPNPVWTFRRREMFLFLVEKGTTNSASHYVSLSNPPHQLSYPVNNKLTLIVLMWRIGWAHNNARK